MSIDPLSMLASPSSLPNISGGDAGPSSAASDLDVSFNAGSAFSVAGAGGQANAKQSNDIPILSETTALFALVVLGAVMIIRGK